MKSNRRLSNRQFVQPPEIAEGRSRAALTPRDTANCRQNVSENVKNAFGQRPIVARSAPSERTLWSVMHCVGMRVSRVTK